MRAAVGAQGAANELTLMQRILNMCVGPDLPCNLNPKSQLYPCLPRRLGAVCCGLLSAAVVLAEVAISPALPNLSPFSWVLHRAEGDQAATEILCFAFLAYPVACAYYGLYKCARSLHGPWLVVTGSLAARRLSLPGS